MKHYTRLFLVSLLIQTAGSAGISFLALLAPLALQAAVRTTIEGESAALAAGWAGLVISTYCAIAAADFWRGRAAERLAARISRRIRRDIVMTNAARADELTGSVELTTVYLSSAESCSRSIASGFPLLLSGILTLGGASLLVAWRQPLAITGPYFLLLAFAGLVFAWTHGQLRKAQGEAVRAERAIARHTNWISGLLVECKTADAVELEAAAIETNAESQYAAKLELQKLACLQGLPHVAFACFVPVVFVWNHLFDRWPVDVPQLLAAQLYIVASFGALTALGGWWRQHIAAKIHWTLIRGEVATNRPADSNLRTAFTVQSRQLLEKSLTDPCPAFLVVTGPNGSGKTVLLKGWSIDTTTLAASERSRAYYLSHRGYIPPPSLVNGAEATGLACATATAEELGVVQEWQSYLRSPDAGVDRFGHALSSGTAQKLAILAALTLEPATLILDEAMNALEREAIVTVWSACRRWRSQRTTIVVDHSGHWDRLNQSEQAGPMPKRLDLTQFV